MSFDCGINCGKYIARLCLMGIDLVFMPLTLNAGTLAAQLSAKTYIDKTHC